MYMLAIQIDPGKSAEGKNIPIFIAGANGIKADNPAIHMNGIGK
jgi:hypothetical protein